MSEKTENLMSDTAPAPRSWAPLVVVYLLSMFAAGLGLVYVVGVERPAAAGEQAAATEGEPPASAGTPATSAQVVSVSAEQVAALDERTQFLGAELTAARGRIQTLERELVSLKEQQVGLLETERARIAKELKTLAAERTTTVTDSRQAVDATLAAALAKLGAESTAEGVRITLAESELRFQPGKATLGSGEPAALGEVARVLQQRPNLRVVLRGHTDSSGDAEANLALSERRALAVRDALVGLGVGEVRIRAQGVGEASPIAANTSAEGRGRNRRVEVFLTQP
ncbi:OmpA family protein [Thiocystis violacea]|uniref:OmpA family protein n=1 Tax=Thiocystis violacea TaxID=13725 RepID=UPI00190485D2|nr:OmpA family protein [Thiocystis violacea]MBK1721239.1 hypothetical protein [Thiocystis violacea]